MPTAAELAILIEVQGNASAQLRALGQDVQRLERQVEGAQRSGGRGGGLLGALTGGVGIGAGLGLVTQALGGMQSLFGAIGESIFGMNARLEQSVATFEALTGSAARAQQVIAALRQEAATSPFGESEIIAAGRALISASDGSTESLLGLVRVAEQLAAIDPAQGLEGAAFAVREALGGDFESLIQRFEISRQAIARFRAEGLSNLQVVTRALQEMGVTSELVERLGRTFEGRRSTIVSFFDEIRRRLGEGIFQRVSDAFGHMVNLIAEHGDRFLRLATDIGQAIGTILQRVATAAQGPLQALLDAFAPGLWAVVAGELERTVEPLQAMDRAAQSAAPAARDLNRELAGIGVLAAEVQIEANRVRQAYDSQIEPLERQLRLLQQSADVQRVQNALATNRATVEGLRLDREIEALRRAAGAATDPNASGLTLRQRLIALALQERELRREELGLEEERRPAIQSVQQQMTALQEQQRQALAPLEAQLAVHRANADAIQLEIRQTDLLRQENDRAAEAIRKAGTGAASPEALEDSRARGEALADEWLTGWQTWVDANGGTVWQAIARSLDNWYQTSGKPTVQRIGADLGTALGTAAADAAASAFGQQVEQRVQELRQNPLLAGFLGGVAGPIGPGIAALPRVAGLPASIAQNGITNEIGPVTVTVGGVNDPGFGERLKTALTDFLAGFILAEAASDPGAPRAVQGSGR